jgi:hypothetical protein
MVSPTLMALPGQLQTENKTGIIFCPNAAGFDQKIEKIAKKLSKTHEK